MRIHDVTWVGDDKAPLTTALRGLAARHPGGYIASVIWTAEPRTDEGVVEPGYSVAVQFDDATGL